MVTRGFASGAFISALVLLLLLPAAVSPAAGAELSPAEPPRIELVLPEPSQATLALDVVYAGEDARKVRQLLDLSGDRDDEVDGSEVQEGLAHLGPSLIEWTEGIRMDLMAPSDTHVVRLALANATGPVSSGEPLSAHFTANLSWTLDEQPGAAHLLTLQVPESAGAARLRVEVPGSHTVGTVQGFAEFELQLGGGAVEGVAKADRPLTVQFAPGARLPEELYQPAPIAVLIPLSALVVALLLRRRAAEPRERL